MRRHSIGAIEHMAGSATATQDSSWWLLPEAVREVAGTIGRPNALKLAGSVYASGAAAHTGRFGTIYVPEKPKGKSFERLARLVGRHSAVQLVAKMGGTELRFGSCSAWANRVRDASIRSYWTKSKLSVAWIGWLHDITERQVRNVCKGEPRQVKAERGPGVGRCSRDA